MALQKDDLEFQLTRTEDWAKNADVKIGVILAFEGVVLLTLARHAIQGLAKTSNPMLLRASCLLAIALLTWSIAKALWGVIPRLRHKQGQGSLLYYYDVQKMPLTDYGRELNHLTASAYRRELASQVHALAKVVSRKMISFRDSVVLLTICLAIMGGVELWQALMT